MVLKRDMSQEEEKLIRSELGTQGEMNTFIKKGSLVQTITSLRLCQSQPSSKDVSLVGNTSSKVCTHLMTYDSSQQNFPMKIYHLKPI